MIRLFDHEAPADPPRLQDGAPGAPRGDSPDQSSQSDQSRFGRDFKRGSRMPRRLALGFAVAGLILSVLYMVRYGSVGKVSLGPVSIGSVSIGPVSISSVSMYTAQSLVYIQPPPSAVPEAAPMHGPYPYDPATYDPYIQQQMLSMTGPDVLAGALKMLAPGVWQQSGESDQSAADRLLGAVEVARVGTGCLAAIAAHANNPETAAALANALAASYIENTAREQKARDAGRLTMLKEEQEHIGKDIDDDRAEQAELSAQLAQMTRSAASATPKQQRLIELANDITHLQSLYNAFDEQLQNGTIEDSAPGTAHLAEAALPPSRFAITGIARNALLLLFALILLGLAAAVIARKMEQRAAAQNRRFVPKATSVSPEGEIPAMAETAAAAIATRAAPPARRVTPEPAAPERVAPELAAPVRATAAPKPLPQSAPVVAENLEAQSLPQRLPVAPTAPRNIAPASLWPADSASQPALRPSSPIMPRPMTPWPTMPGPTTEDLRSQPVRQAETPPAQQLRDEALGWLQREPPWWLTDASAPTDSALTLPRKPLLGAWHSIPAPDKPKPAVAPMREKEKAAEEMPTRLSGLRGMHFSLGVREFSQKKDAERDSAGNRIRAGKGAGANTALVDPGQTMVAEALAPQLEHETVKAKGEETIVRAAAPRWMTAEPEFLFRSAEQTNKSKEARWNRGNEDTGARDGMQILPSKRGQFERG